MVGAAVRFSASSWDNSGETEVRAQNPAKFLAFNLPYVPIPLLLLIRMRKPMPFTRLSALRQGSRRYSGRMVPAG